MADFFLAFVVIFLAEFGDKSQLLVLTQGSRYEVKKIFIGLSLTILILQTISVAAGKLLSVALQQELLGISGSTWLDIITAVLFAFFGVLTLWSSFKEEEEEEDEATGSATSLLGFLTLYFLAEFGDKTNVTTFALAATHHPIAIWLGSSAGFIATSAVALFAAHYISRFLSAKTITRGSGIIFLLLALLQILGLFQ